MPQVLSPIPLATPIIEKDGSISAFFRLRWQELIDSFLRTPTASAVSKLSPQSASIATTAAFTTRVAGYYRVSYYMRKTQADGVSSSLTFTWGWTETGVALPESAAALTTDTTSAQQSGSKTVYADAASDLTYAVAYASNTPGQMKYRLEVRVEQLA
ncbi:MAG TPA: hypothetical protein VGQ19_19545 [Burkholderiales bacterium]|jgi:hypothetical protein|nr:hypothetical protein [Burkholderiales bacterium]